MVEKSHDIVPLFLSQQNRHVTKAGEGSRVDHVPWHHASGSGARPLSTLLLQLTNDNCFLMI